MKDIPINTNYHSFKKIPKFPEEWIITEKRKDELEKYRKNLTLKDEKLKIEGLLVDGSEQILKALNAIDETTVDPAINKTETVSEQVKAKTIVVKR